MKIRCSYTKCFIWLLVVNGVLCNSAKSKSIYFHMERIRNELFSDISNTITIIESLSQNWTENHECLIELNAIKNGIINSDEWAIKSTWNPNQSSRLKTTIIKPIACSVADSWGRLPSGLMSGNFFDLGAFSQCFHIERNGMNYKTQYCIAQLVFPSDGMLNKSTCLPLFVSTWSHKIQFVVWISYIFFFRKLNRLEVQKPSISLGICLPAVCLTDHLESIINDAINKKSSSFHMEIRNYACQFEEFASQLRTIDVVAL